jgi:hypothetical protein
VETQNDHDRIVEIEKEMHAHEIQCEERWKTTFNRLEDIDSNLRRIEGKIMLGAGSLILFLAGVIVTLLTRGL